jgi:hypothetical protein
MQCIISDQPPLFRAVLIDLDAYLNKYNKKNNNSLCFSIWGKTKTGKKLSPLSPQLFPLEQSPKFDSGLFLIPKSKKTYVYNTIQFFLPSGFH